MIPLTEDIEHDNIIAMSRHNLRCEQTTLVLILAAEVPVLLMALAGVVDSMSTRTTTVSTREFLTVGCNRCNRTLLIV
jgi:hypothetical protein